MEHLIAVFAMFNLRMILEAENLFVQILHRSNRAVLGMCSAFKSFRQAIDIIHMAHPGGSLLRQALEERGSGVEEGFGFTKFAGRSGFNLTAQSVCNQLAAVAQTQHRDAHRQNSRVDLRSIFDIDAIRAAGEDQTDWRVLLNLFHGGFSEGDDFAVYTQIADTAGNQLIVLTAKVQDEHGLM